MTHLPSRRQKSPHLRLSPPEVKGLWELGHYSPKGYLYHLILAHRKPGWTWKIDNVSQFCKDWGIARSTFYKAKGALVAEGLIEEKIIGSVELTVISTNECTQPETGVSEARLAVSDGGQGVSDPGLTVSDGRHSTLESIDIKGVCDSTSLKQLTTPTTQSVCVSGNTKTTIKGSEWRTEVDIFDQQPAQVKNAGYSNQAISPGQGIYAPPILLAAKKKFEINLADPHLRRAVELWPERVEVAIACLEEKELTVKHPTRFLQKAIEEQWQPEALAKEKAPDEFQDWFKEARQRGLVVGSQRIDGMIMVYTVDERCVPFDELRQLSWEDLAAQLQAFPDDSPPVNTAPPEQTSAFVPEPEPLAMRHRVSHAVANQAPQLQADADHCHIEIPLLQAECESAAQPPGSVVDDIRRAR